MQRERERRQKGCGPPRLCSAHCAERIAQRRHVLSVAGTLRIYGTKEAARTGSDQPNPGSYRAMQSVEKEAEKALRVAAETTEQLEETIVERDALQKRAREAEQKCKSMQKLIAQYADRQLELDAEIRELETKLTEAATKEEGLLHSEVEDLEGFGRVASHTAI